MKFLRKRRLFSLKKCNEVSNPAARSYVVALDHRFRKKGILSPPGREYSRSRVRSSVSRRRCRRFVEAGLMPFLGMRR